MRACEKQQPNPLRLSCDRSKNQAVIGAMFRRRVVTLAVWRVCDLGQPRIHDQDGSKDQGVEDMKQMEVWACIRSPRIPAAAKAPWTPYHNPSQKMLSF